MSRRLARALAPATALAAVAVAAGCNALPEGADLDNGRELFIAECGTCHTLAEAATASTLGPDLDAAFANARAVGMTDETIEGVVEQQIADPRFTELPPNADELSAVELTQMVPTYMPADIVTGQDAQDVAAYVGEVAGVPGIEPPEAPGGPGGQVFADNGCGSCHTLAAAGSTGTVGPDLDEVLPGQSPEEILTSIVEPDATITQGFEAGVMPSDYGMTIPDEELQQLVDFLAESSGGEGGGG